jgi:transposase
LREAARRLNISRNTAKKYLDQPEMAEPRYAKRQSAPGLLDPYKEQLKQWLKTDTHRTKRDRRTVDAHYQAIRAIGYSRRQDTWSTPSAGNGRKSKAQRPQGDGLCSPQHSSPVKPSSLTGAPNTLSLAAMHRRLEVAHAKLAASRAYLLVAYYAQAHEMLFDAHARAFAVFGGVPRRGIYDNMKTAVDKVGKGKARNVNARFTP